MAEENDPLGEAVGPSLSQKTKEQWVDEGNLLAFYAPIRLEEGLAAYERAIELDSNYGLAYCMKGYVCRCLKRYEESLTAYEQAIRLDPSDIQAYNGKGDTLYVLKHYAEALVAYEQAIRLDPTSVEAYNGKGITLVIGFPDRQEEALAAYEQVTRLDGDPFYTWMAYLNSATILASFSRYEDALVASEGAIRYNSKHGPKDTTAHKFKVAALEALARYEEALATYEEAVRLEPNDVSIWYKIGEVLTSLGRANEAQQAYEKADPIKLIQGRYD